MKIAYIVPSLAKSGPVKVVHQLVKMLSKEHTIDVYYFNVPANRELLIFDAPTYRISLFDKIKFDKYDIIHTHGLKPDAYIWWHQNDIHKTKTVTTLHNYVKEDLSFNYGKIKSFFLVKLWNLMASRHDQIVALSKDAVEYYRRFWRNQNITYVYNGISQVELVTKKREKANHEMIKIGAIASAGGINRRKGIDQVIKALPELPNYTLYIVGKETEESNNLKKLADYLKVLDRVKFLGYHSDIKTFISEMDLFVVSPRSEGFSLALQEIVRYKKPVVCSDITIFRELFTDKEVRFFTLDDIQSLISAIKDVSSHNEEMINRAYEKFIANYTTEKMAKKYLNVYKSLVSRS